MTYEECIKQARELLNFVSPYNCEMIIFDFSNATDFKLAYFLEHELDLGRELIGEKLARDLPNMAISRKCNLAEYQSSNMLFLFELSTAKILHYTYQEAIHKSPEIVKLEMLKLRQMLQSGQVVDEEDGISN